MAVPVAAKAEHVIKGTDAVKIGVFTLFRINIIYGSVLEAYVLSQTPSDDHIPNERIRYNVSVGGAASENTSSERKIIRLLHSKKHSPVWKKHGESGFGEKCILSSEWSKGGFCAIWTAL